VLLLAAIGALGGISILLCSWHRFELSITLILVSPWMGWLLSSNAARTVEEEGVTGAASYIRILLVLLVGCCGMLQFLRSWSTEQTKCFPKYLIFFALFIVYAILSAGYSLDRKFTLIRSFEFLIFFMFLLGFHFWLNNRPKLDTTLNIYYWMIVIGMILNAAALILMPQLVWDWKRPDRVWGFMHAVVSDFGLEIYNISKQCQICIGHLDMHHGWVACFIGFAFITAGRRYRRNCMAAPFGQKYNAQANCNWLDLRFNINIQRIFFVNDKTDELSAG
jgi:hypothetical protein